MMSSSTRPIAEQGYAFPRQNSPKCMHGPAGHSIHSQKHEQLPYPAFAMYSSVPVHLTITSKQVLNLAFPPKDHTQTIICLPFSIHSGLPTVLAFLQSRFEQYTCTYNRSVCQFPLSNSPCGGVHTFKFAGNAKLSSLNPFSWTRVSGVSSLTLTSSFSFSPAQ